MNKIILPLLGLLALSLTTFGQRPQRDSVPPRVDAAKIGYLSTRMQLTPEEAQSFWPLYNEFVRTRREIIVSLGVEGPIERLSDEEVKDALDKMLEREEKVAELHREYVGRFLEVVSPRQVLLMHDAERRFNRELLERLRDRRAAPPRPSRNRERPPRPERGQ